MEEKTLLIRNLGTSVVGDVSINCPPYSMVYRYGRWKRSEVPKADLIGKLCVNVVSAENINASCGFSETALV